MFGFVFAVATNFVRPGSRTGSSCRCTARSQVGPDSRLYTIVSGSPSAPSCRCRRSTSFPSRRPTRSPPAATRARRGGRHRRHPADADRRRARRRARARTGAREAPRHPHQFGCRHACGDDHDGGALRDVLRRRPQRRSRRAEPDCPARDDDAGADCRDADPDGDFALARVRRGRRRRARSPAARSGWSARCGKSKSASKAVPLDANPATAHMFIIKPFSVGGSASLFSTHPPTERPDPGACCTGS